MSSAPRHISIDDYDYDLPDERIAKYPLPQRDGSNLLVYQDGNIRHAGFRSIIDELPSGSLLVFNNTRVIHARLYFTLPNGRRLEILCLEPLLPAEYQQNLSSTAAVQWKCLIGGNRKWKSGVIDLAINTPMGAVRLRAERIERLEDAFSVAFSWDNEQLSFGELLAAGGIIPLPPYLNRASEESDEDRYQTVYAEPEGSVAAPTAGLHFTEEVLATLREKQVGQQYVTLHVGAGTFKPVKADQLGDHEMHQESIFVERSAIGNLLEKVKEGASIIPVGTTSLRTLESLYWFGVGLYFGEHQDTDHLIVKQWDPYRHEEPLPSAAEALTALHQWLLTKDLEVVEGQTQLLIAPGYPSRLISALITNFHQPRSTLLLLVAALIGDDWKQVYDYAMRNDFRFLSYGDSSLLWTTK